MEGFKMSSATIDIVCPYGHYLLTRPVSKTTYGKTSGTQECKGCKNEKGKNRRYRWEIVGDKAYVYEIK